jgi:hypothetical protein
MTVYEQLKVGVWVIMLSNCINAADECKANRNSQTSHLSPVWCCLHVFLTFASSLVESRTCMLQPPLASTRVPRIS